MQTLDAAQATRPVYNILKLTYGLVPIVAGLDKFSNLLTHWENYLNPQIASMLPFTPHTFMMIVGAIEMIAGILVLMKPTIGAYVVMGRLLTIAITLLAAGNYLDIAVRDIVMAIGAYSFGTLARIQSYRAIS